ncbi:MAG: hypothetical protein WBQ78_14155 [Gammaproteobacteria bacterium]
MHQSNPLKSINKLVFYTSLLLLLASCWQRNEFPVDLSVAPALLATPLQRAVSMQPFTVANNGTDYRIEPHYQYDLHGLVVSYAHHNGNYSLHRLWNDHINVADVCVVWSDNTSGSDLNRIKFWNGKFTCNFQTDDAGTWERFRQDQISNNHLLTDDVRLRKQIKRVRIGDQVRIRGWLVNYSNDAGFSRGTSTTRSDKGNGACETIYLKEFEILQPLDNGWRTLMNLALAGVIGSSLLWLVAVMRGHF